MFQIHKNCFGTWPTIDRPGHLSIALLKLGAYGDVIVQLSSMELLKTYQCNCIEFVVVVVSFNL